METDPTRPSFGRYGSALVAVEDERAALASVLVLQEMGFSVDIARDHAAALAWAGRATYAVVICGTGDAQRSTQFAIRIRFCAPQTRVLLLTDPAVAPEALDEIGIELLAAPIDVNMLVERLWPAEAE